MRAVVFREHGPAGNLALEDVRRPEPSAGEVVIRVRACGVNRLDLRLREGKVGAKVGLPHISGSEIAGDIDEIGSGVAGLAPGDRIVVAPYLFCGSCEYCQTGEESVCIRGNIVGLSSDGGYAEYVAVPATNAIPLPSNVSYEEAAAVGLAALTAWHALVSRAAIRPGETVLVHSAGSGVGSAGIQIARLAGARVITTASTGAKLARGLELGADEAINYAETDFVQEVRRITGKRGVDVVLEHIGAETWEKSSACLARNGRLVICGTTSGEQAPTNLWNLFAKQLRLIGSYGGSRAELRTVIDLVSRGRLRPVIAEVFPLERAADAQRLMEERGQFGKILLVP
ncbi:MAG TPA: zinc-binding dehydrogenase [Chloroflexota bacterium]